MKAGNVGRTVITSLLVTNLLGVLLSSQSATSQGNGAAIATFAVKSGELRLLEAKRAKTWAGVGSSGFSASTAAEGREFIILKYELTAATRDDLLPARYTKIEVANGELFGASDTGGKPLSETAIAIEQFFSVPQGATPRALHFGTFVPNPADPTRPNWSSAVRVDLSKVSLKLER